MKIFTDKLDLSGNPVNQITDFDQITRLPDDISVVLGNCGITEIDLPDFVFNTWFDNISLKNNRLNKPDIIQEIDFICLDVSNNPVDFGDKDLSDKRIICNYYFENKYFAERLCGKKANLTYEQAYDINGLDISNIEVENIRGVESLPKLKHIVINIYQLKLLDNMFFKYSPLERIYIRTYGLNQLTNLKKFYLALKSLIIEERNYGNVCYAAKVIMDFSVELLASFELCCVLDQETAVTKGVKSLTSHLNMDLSLFFRRVIDAFNCAKALWDGDTEKNEENQDIAKIGEKIRINYDDVAELDCDKILIRVCKKLNIAPVLPERFTYLLLQFFAPIHEILKECEPDYKKMEALVSGRVGKNVKVQYLDNPRSEGFFPNVKNFQFLK